MRQDSPGLTAGLSAGSTPGLSKGKPHVMPPVCHDHSPSMEDSIQSHCSIVISHWVAVVLRPPLPLFISLLRFPSPSSMSLCLENLILSQTSTAPLECDPIHIPLANFGNPEHKFQPPSLGHILGFLAKHPWSSSSSLFTTARRGP